MLLLGSILIGSTYVQDLKGLSSSVDKPPVCVRLNELFAKAAASAAALGGDLLRVSVILLWQA